MSGWSIPLDKLADAAGARLSTVARKATFDLFRNVVLRSPVDTGRFRANWNFSLDAPDTATTGGIDKKESGGAGFTGQFGGEIRLTANQGRGLDEAARALTGKIGGVTYFSNGLPYATVLEYGRDGGKPGSKQAPAGMVRITAQEFSAYVQKAIRA